jgi:tetratricopeptide (TPR) repeat protein
MSLEIWNYNKEEQMNQNVKNEFSKLEEQKLNVEYRLKKICGFIKYENYDEAIKDLDEFNRKYPLIVEGYHIKFRVHCIKKRYIEAKKVIDYAMKLFPENEKLQQDEMMIQDLLKDYEEALYKVKDNKYLEASNEDLRNLSFEKAKVYAEENDTNNTIKYLEKAISYEGDKVDREARSCIMNHYLKAEQYDKLIKNSEVLVKEEDSRDPSLMSAYYYRALSFRMLNKDNEKKYYNEACKIYKNVTISKPTNIDAYLLRVLCHKDLKEYSKALELIDCILMLEKDYKPAIDLKAVIYREMEEERKIKFLKTKNLIYNAVL